MNYQITYIGVSHTGHHRKMNQDNLICDRQYMAADNHGTGGFLSGVCKGKELPWFGVFDGMGGEEKGEVAAFLAAETAFQLQGGKAGFVEKLKGVLTGDYIENKMTDFCRKANERICEYTVKNRLQSMGTTAAVLIFSVKQVHLCNVGDSKIFRCRDGKLRQLSKDHVLTVPCQKKTVLYQNLGIMESEMIIEPYFGKEILKENDIYLICSDGLTDMLTIEEIEDTLLGVDLKDASQGLLNQALVRGGKDNITLILCKIEKTKGI